MVEEGENLLAEILLTAPMRRILFLFEWRASRGAVSLSRTGIFEKIGQELPRFPDSAVQGRLTPQKVKKIQRGSRAASS